MGCAFGVHLAPTTELVGFNPKVKEYTPEVGAPFSGENPFDLDTPPPPPVEIVTELESSEDEEEIELSVLRSRRARGGPIKNVSDVRFAYDLPKYA